ncbi:hypothetical protein Tco_0600130 [Tanacetum coccineum]|uniref:Reverse transcriptase domain-containing protein n=1 Tax=Tanacetum coccineum TaxID=301880 RepID=A0ABQ4WAX6_9ASTR
MKAIALNKGAQIEQRKGAAQSGKEMRNLRERQSTSHPNDEDEGIEGPMIIEAEIRGHCIYRISVNSSWNVKAPGGRRIHYSKKQQVGFAGMCVGLRTRRGPRALKPMVEERVKVAINPEYPEQTVMIGSTLTDEGRNKLCDLLQRNLDIFAWKPADMTGVPRHITEHCLKVAGRNVFLFRQNRQRGQAMDKNQAIQEEVGKLMEAGIIKEVHYHDWLSNPVMVKKHDDS